MDMLKAPDSVNFTRYDSRRDTGHYESFFVRANHPSRPQAFWIRYTIFSPERHPERAIGELWSVYFDGEKGRHSAAKAEFPMHECEFPRDRFDIKIGRSRLGPRGLAGGIKNRRIDFKWKLSYSGTDTPIFDFPLKYYESGFPKAKPLVALPFATFDGAITINGKTINIHRWVGSQNHNWGSKHTDHYAWGQVAGFDNDPGSFLEIGTGRIKIGPLWTPFMTIMVLRHEGREYRLNEYLGFFNRATFSYFNWSFAADSNEISLKGNIHASGRDFACLPYYNPPGGVKFCLNTKIAACRIELKDKPSGAARILETANRAAFEILTDLDDHGMKPDI
jgi:hypothetical protein